MPIALGHFDEDGVLDVVLPTAVWSSGACQEQLGILSCDWTVVAAQSPDDDAVWTEAKVADLNGDGRDDVIGARASMAGGHQGLDILLSGLSRVLSPRPHATDGAPRDLTLEDFDGDGLVDVAYVVPAPERDCSVADQVFVVFGGAPPASPVRVAELPGIQNVAADTLLFAPDRFDGIGDLGMATACPSAADPATTEHAVAVLLGTPRRLLESPLPLQLAADDARNLFAMGDVTGDGALDVVTVGPLVGHEGRPAPLAFWVIPAIGEAEVQTAALLRSQELATSIPPVVSFDGVGRAHYLMLQRAALVAGSVGCNPLAPGAAEDPRCAADEAVLFLSSESLPGIGDRDAPRIFVPQLDGVSVGFPSDPAACGLDGGLTTILEWTQDTNALSGVSFGPSSKRTEATLVDLDGDGFNEVVGWWYGPTGEVESGVLADPPGFAGGTAVFWNEPGFSTCPERLAVPEGEVVVRIAALRGGLIEPTVVVATDRAVRVVRPGTDRTLDACLDPGDDTRCLTVLTVDEGAASGFVRDVAVLDVDQDGLDDLVVLRDGGIEVLRHVPRSQASAGPRSVQTDG